MWILLGITVSMMLPVHYCVSPWVQERCALKNVCQQVEYSFPEFAHGKHPVRCIAMLKKCLKEQGQKPVGNKKKKNDHKINLKHRTRVTYFMMNIEM